MKFFDFNGDGKISWVEKLIYVALGVAVAHIESIPNIF